MTQITAKTGAWLSAYRAAQNSDPHDSENMTFTTCDMASEGWVKVGDAEITVTLRDKNEVTAGQVAVLREAKRRIQAEAEAQITQIDGRIQSLLALPMEI